MIQMLSQTKTTKELKAICLPHSGENIVKLEIQIKMLRNE